MGVTEKQLKRYSARVRRQRRLRRLTLAALALLAVFLLVDRNFRPLVFSLAEARSAAMATRALNAALTEALEDGVDYDDLMNVRMDDGGQVSLLSANTMRMNALAERAGDAALRKLETVSAQKVDVPLGAALGLTLLAGSGPRIPISIVPVGSVQTDFETEFEACGHQSDAAQGLFAAIGQHPHRHSDGGEDDERDGQHAGGGIHHRRQGAGELRGIQAERGGAEHGAVIACLSAETMI